jgi:hypothetical protein
MMTFIISASLMAASGAGGDDTLYSSQLSTPSGTATIIQSGPLGEKPIVRKRTGPGFSILQQESGGNSAIVIQRQSGE